MTENIFCNLLSGVSLFDVYLVLAIVYSYNGIKGNATCDVLEN